MATRLRTVVHCVLLTGLIMSPLTLVALAADAPLEVKKTTSDAQPVQRKVRATLLVHATEPVVWRAENKFDLAQFDFYKRNVAAMVKSSVVIDKALEEKSVRDLPLIKQHGDNATDWLADQIKIEYPGNAEVMTISMVAEDRDQACMIVNAVASAFMKEVVDKERTDKLGRNDNLDKKFRAYKQQVLEKQRQLYELNQSIGTNDAETARIKYKMEVDTLDSFMRTRAEIQKQVFDLSLKNDMAKLMKKNAENNNVSETEIEAAISKDLRIQRAIAELAELSRQQREAERAAKDNASDAAVVQIRDRIAVVRQTIDEIKNADRQHVIEQVKNQGAEMQKAELEQKLLIDQYGKLTQQIEAQAVELQKLERFSGDADQLRADVAQLQVIVREMGNTLERWRIELDAGPRIEVLEPAH